jgi:hypothetical protein
LRARGREPEKKKPQIPRRALQRLLKIFLETPQPQKKSQPMQDTNVRGPSGECAVASMEARVCSRINIWNCKRKSNKQLGPLKELLGTLQIFTTIMSLLSALPSHRLKNKRETQGSFKLPRHTGLICYKSFQN